MFEVKHIKGNTYYFEAFSNIGIYCKDDGKAILIDSCDHMRMVKNVDSFLTERGLTVEAIINTHGHADHICGNKFFSEKYGCRILSTEMEKFFIRNPHLEMDFYFEGIQHDKRQNPFYTVEATDSEVITKDNLPEGFSIVALPGHSFEMIGVRTPDNVLFLSDSLLSEFTWENHKLPFFNHVNTSLATLERIKEMEADFFVPTHDKITTDIRQAADYNIRKLNERKDLICSFCEGLCFDEIIFLLIEKCQINVRPGKYAMYTIMLRKLLQSLIEDGRITSEYKGMTLIYKKV